MRLKKGDKVSFYLGYKDVDIDAEVVAVGKKTISKKQGSVDIKPTSYIDSSVNQNSVIQTRRMYITVKPESIRLSKSKTAKTTVQAPKILCKGITLGTMKGCVRQSTNGYCKKHTWQGTEKWKDVKFDLTDKTFLEKLEKAIDNGEISRKYGRYLPLVKCSYCDIKLRTTYKKTCSAHTINVDKEREIDDREPDNKMKQSSQNEFVPDDITMNQRNRLFKRLVELNYNPIADGEYNINCDLSYKWLMDYYENNVFDMLTDMSSEIFEFGNFAPDFSLDVVHMKTNNDTLIKYSFHL